MGIWKYKIEMTKFSTTFFGFGNNFDLFGELFQRFELFIR